MEFEALLNTLAKTLAEAKVNTLGDTLEDIDFEHWSISRLTLQHRWRPIHTTTHWVMCGQKHNTHAGRCKLGNGEGVALFDTLDDTLA